MNIVDLVCSINNYMCQNIKEGTEDVKGDFVDQEERKAIKQEEEERSNAMKVEAMKRVRVKKVVVEKEVSK